MSRCAAEGARALALSALLAGCPGRTRGPELDAAPYDAAEAGLLQDTLVTEASAPAPRPFDVLLFRASRSRSAWNDQESTLTPEAVRGPRFGHLWDSPPFDDAVLAGRSVAPHTYATPLFVHGVAVREGSYAGLTLDLVLAATSNGDVYALSARAQAGGAATAGAIVWRRRLVTPTLNPSFEPSQSFDGGVALGTLSTPAADLATGRLYVTALDASAGWQLFALGLGTGAVLPGWPVALTHDTLSPLNRNPPARLAAGDHTVQRGALNLSPDGALLFAGFSSQDWTATGWMVAVDTRSARVASSFAVASSGDADGRGGIWGPGGAAVDDDGSVYVTTGNGLEGAGPRPGWWGDSLLRWSPSLELTGSYSPFNYCDLDAYDMDLASSSPVLFELDPARTSTPRLLAFGGKQGALYLLHRDGLARGRVGRPACDRLAPEDESLLPPEPQPHFGARGPLQLFGPWSSRVAAVDFARMHTTLAHFRDAAGASYLFATGASKRSEQDPTSVPPCVARVAVRSAPGQPAWLELDALESVTTLQNPGSPVLTAERSRGAVLWVLDANQRRSAWLAGPTAAHPVLYAFDASSLALLWRSAENELSVGGKYGSPTVVDGVAYVATDRLQAFGLR